MTNMLREAGAACTVTMFGAAIGWALIYPRGLGIFFGGMAGMIVALGAVIIRDL